MRLTLLAAVIVVAAGAGTARAYPQFQLSSGSTRCSQCHIAPGGGGLLTGWGRSESADFVALGDAESTLGDPGFLHGLWDPPKWLALGGDLRHATLYKKMPEQDPYWTYFPMQADLSGHVQVGAWSFSLTGGLRGGARDDDPVPSAHRVVSREHYLMWRPRAAAGPYVRAGRFFPVFGLRVADHTAYIRRRLGFHSLEEPTGVGAGVVRDRWEAHASLFVPSPIWRAGPAQHGGTLYYERRLDDRTAIGAQAKLTIGDGEVGWLGGGVGKLWLPGPRLLLLGEVDGGVRHLSGGPTFAQLALHAGVTWFAHRGVMLSSVLERYHADLALEADARDAINLSVQFFPRAHFELHAVSKLEFQGNRHGTASGYGLLMLHYWL